MKNNNNFEEKEQMNDDVLKVDIQEELKNLSKQISNISTGKLILFSIFSLSIYLWIWMYKIIGKLNILNLSKKYKAGLWISYILSILLLIVCIVNGENSATDKIGQLSGIFFIIFTYTAINVVKTYCAEKYYKVIKVNHLGAIFFSVFYLNFFINTLDKRLK